MNKYASYLDWRNPHMPIAVTANSLQHWPSPSKRRPVSHTVRDGRASLSHRANNRRSCYRFVNFWLWGAYPWAKGHQKGRWPAIHLHLPSYKISAGSRKRSMRYALPRFFPLFGLAGYPRAKVHQKGIWPGSHPALPPCKISSSYINPRPRYPLPKSCWQTKQQTNSKQYIPSMPIGIRHVGITNQQEMVNSLHQYPIMSKCEQIIIIIMCQRRTRVQWQSWQHLTSQLSTPSWRAAIHSSQLLWNQLVRWTIRQFPPSVVSVNESQKFPARIEKAASFTSGCPC